MVTAGAAPPALAAILLLLFHLLVQGPIAPFVAPQGVQAARADAGGIVHLPLQSERGDGTDGASPSFACAELFASFAIITAGNGRCTTMSNAALLCKKRWEGTERRDAAFLRKYLLPHLLESKDGGGRSPCQYSLSPAAALQGIASTVLAIESAWRRQNAQHPTPPVHVVVRIERAMEAETTSDSQQKVPNERQLQDPAFLDLLQDLASSFSHDTSVTVVADTHLVTDPAWQKQFGSASASAVYAMDRSHFNEALTLANLVQRQLADSVQAHLLANGFHCRVVGLAELTDGMHSVASLFPNREPYKLQQMASNFIQKGFENLLPRIDPEDVPKRTPGCMFAFKDNPATITTLNARGAGGFLPALVRGREPVKVINSPAAAWEGIARYQNLSHFFADMNLTSYDNIKLSTHGRHYDPDLTRAKMTALPTLNATKDFHERNMTRDDFLALLSSVPQGHGATVSQTPVPPLVYFHRVPSAVREHLQPYDSIFLAEEDYDLHKQFLWLSSKGSITHLHFDQDFNFFIQLVGQKRFLLISPSQTDDVAIFPRLHPLWHKSRIDAMAACRCDDGDKAKHGGCNPTSTQYATSDATGSNYCGGGGGDLSADQPPSCKEPEGDSRLLLQHGGRRCSGVDGCTEAIHANQCPDIEDSHQRRCKWDEDLLESDPTSAAFYSTRAFSVTVKAGEALYLPPYYWHAVETQTTPSLSLSTLSHDDHTRDLMDSIYKLDHKFDLIADGRGKLFALRLYIDLVVHELFGAHPHVAVHYAQRLVSTRFKGLDGHFADDPKICEFHGSTLLIPTAQHVYGDCVTDSIFVSAQFKEIKPLEVMQILFDDYVEEMTADAVGVERVLSFFTYCFVPGQEYYVTTLGTQEHAMWDYYDREHDDESEE